MTFLLQTTFRIFGMEQDTLSLHLETARNIIEPTMKCTTGETNKQDYDNVYCPQQDM